MIIKAVLSVMLLSTLSFALSDGCKYLDEGDISHIQISRKNVHCFAEAVVEEINQQTPELIDKYTTLQSVTLKEKLMTYKYTLQKVLDKDISSQLAKNMHDDMISFNCSDEAVRTFIKNGIEFDHRYYDKKGVLLFHIIVNEKICVEHKKD
jgi:hypothetical protein